MTDDSHATLQQLIGRQNDPAPDVRGPQPEADGVDSQYQRAWLVLATHVQGLLKTGVIDERSAIAIAGALDRVGQGGVPTGVSGVRAQTRSLEERVDAALPAELVGAATLGIAVEDWSLTAMRLAIRSAVLDSAAAATRMQAALIAMADLHTVSLMQGFHTGRPVQPVTFGHLLGGAIGPVGQALSRLLEAAALVNRSPLGAGTMAGEVVGAERADSADAIGFDGAVPNTYDAVANVEDVVAALDAVSAVCAPVSRMLGELATFVRTDPSSFVFADEWMREDGHLPGYTAVEGLRAVSENLSGVVLSCGAMAARLRSLPYGPIGSAVDWIDADVRDLMHQATEHLGTIERLFRSELTVNRAYLANRAGRDYTTSNDLATFLMTEEQLPPSVSRNIASLTMRRMREEAIEMSAITPEMLDTAAMLVIGRELKVEMETLGRWFAPRRFLERRLVEGAPAPSKAREWLEREAGEQRRLADVVQQRQQRIRDAEQRVRDWVTTMASEEDD